MPMQLLSHSAWTDVPEHTSERSQFVTGAVRVRVPATSANLGPGFDSFALALSWYDEVEAVISDEPGVRVQVSGEGADEVPLDERHLVVMAMMAGFDELGPRPSGINLFCTNRIPHGRGLGSSAAAIVSGLVIARGLTVGGDVRLSDGALLELAARLEGHPDNVAACVLGGFTISWAPGALDSGRVDCADAIRLEVTSHVVPVVCVPTTQMSTSTARGLLPSQVPHGDASSNVARAALLVAAITGLTPLAELSQLLMTATADRLHQPYRRSAYPDSAALVDDLRAAGIAAVISGAGPTVLALAVSHEGAPDEVGRNMADAVAAIAGPTFTARAVSVSTRGAALLPAHG